MSNQLLSSDLLEKLRQIDSPTICNAIEHFKVRDQTTGYAHNELVCQFPDQKPMVGYAVTCTATTTTPGDSRTSQVDKLVEVVEAAPQPSVVVIQQTGHDLRRTCFLGDLFCTTMRKLGSVGVVTDGNYRDRSGIQQRAPDYQVFSPGRVVSHGWGVFFDFNVTVTVCGLTIQPGDLLHGDESGLLTVPIDIVEPVLKQAQVVLEQEAELLDFLGGDRFSMEELKRRFSPH